MFRMLHITLRVGSDRTHQAWMSSWSLVTSWWIYRTHILRLTTLCSAHSTVKLSVLRCDIQSSCCTQTTTASVGIWVRQPPPQLTVYGGRVNLWEWAWTRTQSGKCNNSNNQYIALHWELYLEKQIIYLCLSLGVQSLVATLVNYATTSVRIAFPRVQLICRLR